MALTKHDIVDSIQERFGFSRQKTIDAVESLLELIKSALGKGEDVLISGFGKFCVHEKKARRGRNPATGDEMILPPRKVVGFKCSGKLRDKINSDQ